jgi:hypothetical protein
MRKIIITLFLFCAFTAPQMLMAQDSKEAPVDFSCDFVSRYVWRGLNLGGNTPSMQPTIGLEFGKGNHAFTLGAFGAYSFGGQQLQESDLFLSYTFKELLTLTFTDYFFPMDDGSSPRYFNYKSDVTGHLFEGTFVFEGTEKFPFSLLFAMNFYGADARKLNEDGTDNGIMASKYVEVGYAKTFKNIELEVFAGAALDNPDETRGETGFYGNKGIGVINLGCKLTKEVKLGSGFTLPVQTQFIFNPEAERVFFVFGFTI